MIPARRRLLARLGAAEPSLLRLCAPPGYGKTNFAAAWARRFERHAVCDCGPVSSMGDFAGRVMSALAEESAAGSALARERLFLHVTEADDAAWSRTLLECWKLRQERALLVLENADALASQTNVLALVGDMLAARPAERAVLLSSREPLPLDVGRYLAPHQVLTLGPAELQLDGEEAASVFEGSDLAQPIVDRILRLAAGWPMALLLLARIAHYEPELEQLLDRLDASVADPHEYLLGEVLSALTPEMTTTLLAAAAIGEATLEDISAATDISHAAPIVEGLLRLPGFISYESGAYRMHPLLHTALRTRYGAGLSEYVLRAAGGNALLGDFLRAGELYNIAGDCTAAAAALDRLPAAALQQPSPRLIEAIAQIPVSVIVARPGLWMAILRDRGQTVDVERLHRESIALQQNVAQQTAPALYRRLGVRRALLASHRNLLEEARTALESLGPASGVEESPEERRLILMTSAVVTAKQGLFLEADAFVEQADAVHGARHLHFDEERAVIAMEKTATHGDWDGLLKIAEERLSVALRTGPTERIVEAARALARAAWYGNNDDRVAAAHQIAKDCGLPAVDAIEEAALADLQAALGSGDLERAAALLDRAIERIDRSENDFLRIVVRVCAALLAPAQRRRLVEARTIAGGIESAPLQTSIELLIDSPEPRDYGIFKRLAVRVARSPLRTRHDRLFVDIVRGQVRQGSEVLHVSDRGLELLAALALFDAGTSNEKLAAALWPSLDRKAAVNALKMCVSRTRAQVGDRESIQNARAGYVLGEQVGCDVRECERILQAARSAGMLGESLRQQLRQLLNAWGDPQPAHAAEWKWFAPFSVYLAKLRSELSGLLAKDAVRRENGGAREAVAP
jgi:ATP/maltotriose-dependent transcriptional regulator MalT